RLPFAVLPLFGSVSLCRVNRVKFGADVLQGDSTDGKRQDIFLEVFPVRREHRFQGTPQDQKRLGPGSDTRLCWTVSGNDNERRQHFAGYVLPDLDNFYGAVDFRAFRAVTQEFDKQGYRVAVADYCKLTIDSARQGRMASRTGFVPSAMMDNDNKAFECFTDCSCRENVRGHICVLTF